MTDNQPQAPPQQPTAAPQPAPRTHDPVHGDLLAHEPEPIRAAMKHPAYMDAAHPEHAAMVERVYALRVAQEGEPGQQPGQQPADRVAGFAPGPVAAPADAPDNGVATAVFPSGVPVALQQTWSALANDVGLGGRELSGLATSALPYLNDGTRYSYDTGRAALVDQLGDKADAAVKDAKALIKEYPGLLRVLEARGLASHPGVVRALAERHQAREQLRARLAEVHRDPEYLQLKGERDHERHRQLVEEAAAIQEALHG
jgi:hypothetical protein